MSATLLINVDDNLLARLGLTANYGVAALAALLVAMLVAGRKLPVVVLVVILSLIANMPQEFPLNFGMNREVFFGLMVSLVIAPYLAHIFDF
jgi:hypothetical protein